jgi:DNA modification methylase
MPNKKESKMNELKIKIEPPKGRPMLYWVGKKPLEYVKGFPARLTEVFDPQKTGLRHEPPIFKNLERDWQNLLFQGDNKEVLATLLENGFRDKVDLIYIDPPFNTGVDYVRRITLRGIKSQKLEGEEYSVQEQTMYFNNFADDAYLQWMYERLQLLKELLAETGSIFVRMDYHFGHYIKAMMDEIFGKENFKNEIVVKRTRTLKGESGRFHTATDSIYFYGKSDISTFYGFRTLKETEKQEWVEMHLPGTRKDESLLWRTFFGKKIKAPEGRRWALSQEAIDNAISKGLVRINPETGMPQFLTKYETIGSNWTDIPGYADTSGYPTENSPELLERVISSASSEGDLVLDCFIGSGTTAAVAQKLGRRWIGCDINKGAIQTTSKRLQKIILEQIKEKKEAPAYSFGVYQVNDYDLKILRTEAIELAIEHIGIERRKTDSFFDGTLGKELVKIIDFNHPLTLLDLQLLEDELKKRSDEERNIVLVCLGKELAVDPWIDDWNKKHPVNKIRVIELRTDKKYGKFLVHQPAMAKVKIERKGDKAIIDILDFVSPTIIERLNDPQSVFKVKIPDFRAMIDVALIDTNYDGKTFHIVYSDVPKKKSDYVNGHYELDIPKKKTTIAVKIIDMLGEEVLVTEII